MTELGSLDYELKRDVSALCQMVEDDYPQENVYHRYGVILSSLSELVLINRRAREGAAPEAGEKPLMVKSLVPDWMLIPGDLLLDWGVELPADAPPGAVYRMVEVQSG